MKEGKLVSVKNLLLRENLLHIVNEEHCTNLVLALIIAPYRCKEAPRHPYLVAMARKVRGHPVRGLAVI